MDRAAPTQTTLPRSLRRLTGVAAMVAVAVLPMATPVAAAGADREEIDAMSWKDRLKTTANEAIENVDEFVDVTWRRFARRMGFNEPRHIAAYRGYGNHEKLWVRGRLLANKPYGGPQDDDDWWDNLQATYQRWESDEVPDAEVRLEYADTVVTVTTDDEGYYAAEFTIDRDAPRPDVVVAEHDLDDRTLTAVHRVTLLDPDAEFMIVSDMDDTVIHTGITDLLLSAQLTFLNNAKTRKPLTGVGGLYRSLVRNDSGDPVHPIFYLSNSGWNMYDLLRDFLDLNDLPAGPLLLRDLGVGSDTSDHKIETLRRLFERYSLPVVLVGDSGQHDAEIYARVAREHPGRVRAIYIRDVDPDDDSEYDGNVDRIIAESEALGIPFRRVRDSAQIAAHAAEIGLLPSDEVAEVAVDVAVDRGRETVTEEAMGGVDR